MELKADQWNAVKAAFEQGKLAEVQYAAGEPVRANLVSYVRAGDEYRLSGKERQILDELKQIERALKSASKTTRALLVEPGQYIDEWLNRVSEYVHLYELSADPQQIGDELHSLGLISLKEAQTSDFSPAGRAHNYARYEAVEALRRIWVSSGKSDRRGGHRNTSFSGSGNHYKFNDFVLWVGAALLKLDPTLNTDWHENRQEGDEISKRNSLENSCYQVWCILGELQQ